MKHSASATAPTLTAESIRNDLRRNAPASVPEWRRLRTAWSRQLRDRPAREVIRIARELVDDSQWGRLTAYELIADHAGAMAALTPSIVRDLADGLVNWWCVDTFACSIAGPAWRDGVIPTSVLDGWLKSSDHWLRRTAVVCTVPLNVRNRGGRGDARRTLAVCRQVIDDREDMVVKALSWALRSLVEWDAAAVAAFLHQYDARLAGRVKREVRHKLSTGKKQ